MSSATGMTTPLIAICVIGFGASTIMYIRKHKLAFPLFVVSWLANLCLFAMNWVVSGEPSSASSSCSSFSDETFWLVIACKSQGFNH